MAGCKKSALPCAKREREAREGAAACRKLELEEENAVKHKVIWRDRDRRG